MYFSSIAYIQGFDESAGVFVYTVTATDADIGTNQQIQYSLTGDFVEFFSINRSTGVITVSPIGVDYEAVASNPVLIFTVIAMDEGMNGLGDCEYDHITRLSSIYVTQSVKQPIS